MYDFENLELTWVSNSKKSPAINKTMFDVCAALVMITTAVSLSCNSSFVVCKTVLDNSIHIGHLYFLQLLYCVPNRIAEIVDMAVYTGSMFFLKNENTLQL